jgi:hypothetical protein
MHRMFAVLTFVSLAAVSSAPASEPFGADASSVEAVRDFYEVRAELGLSGSAPLAGMENRRDERAWEQGARRDFETVQGDQGLSGSSPLAGLERYEYSVRPQVAPVILAQASVRGR